MLQRDEPQDFVIGTGETHTVQRLCEVAFGYLDLDYKKYVVQDERFYRPAEVDLLISNPARAKKVLGWQPSVNFEGLVKMMVDADLERLKRARN
jgi:GDPmannose 4,6-dehydratase